MPVSKKRKRKGGTVAQFKRDRYAERRRQIEADIEAGEHMSSGVTLQDLINMVAYQEYQEQGVIEGPEIPDAPEELDYSDPTVKAVIRALDESRQSSNDKIEEENEDGR